MKDRHSRSTRLLSMLRHQSSVVRIAWNSVADRREELSTGRSSFKHRFLLGAGLYDLAHQLGPIHGDCCIDRTGFGPAVVFENFDHERCVVR